MAASSISLSLSLSLPPLTSTFSSNQPRNSLKLCTPSLQFTSSSTLPTQKTNLFSLLQRISQKRRIFATSEDVLPPPPDTTIETTQQIAASSGDGGVSNIISVLLFIAFVGLSILTIGVVYIAVTDFLTKREREKFEKEEAAKKSKKKGKRVVRSRIGPKGFGQKIEEDYDD